MSPATSRARAVFDCNILIQAVAYTHSASATCMELFESGRVELFVSRRTLAELRRVLEYEEVLAISPNMTRTRVDAFVQRLSFRATRLRHIRHVMDYPRDPNDEPYIDLAVAAKAEFLVSRDKDLLSLMTGHSAIDKTFRRKARGLRVLTPENFLKSVGHPWQPTHR